MGEGKWKNKTRTLVIGSRGLDYRSRHFMEDLRRMMAHAIRYEAGEEERTGVTSRNG